MRGPILAGRSILIIEDEPLIALDIEIDFRRVGAKVLSTAYFWVGLHFAEHPGLSAAVLDLRLGLEDCTAICRRLSELRIPFMFYSGYGALLRMRFGRMLRSSASPQKRSGSWRPWSACSSCPDDEVGFRPADLDGFVVAHERRYHSGQGAIGR
jgi:hypothetical protein